MTPENFKRWAEDTVRTMRLAGHFHAKYAADTHAFNDSLAEHDAEACALMAQASAASNKMYECMAALVQHLQTTYDIPTPPLPTADFSNIAEDLDPQAG